MGNRPQGESGEPWEDGQTQRRMLLDLLLSLRDDGPMTDDAAARLCVSRDELAGLMRDIDKLALSLATADGLGEFLDDTGGVGSLAGAIHDWRKHASIVRWSFKWEKLPPAVCQRVQRRHAALIEHARQRQWIARDAGDKLWHITDAGRAAIDELSIPPEASSDHTGDGDAGSDQGA
jgi:hypothetical protein